MGGICVHAPLQWDTAGGFGETSPPTWTTGSTGSSPVRRIWPSCDALQVRRAPPVINARTRQNHPCETLGDLAFHLHRHGRIEGIKVGVVAPKSNILGSWIEAASVLPINVVQVYPDRWLDQDAAASTPRFRTSADMDELVNADLVVTDCWPTDAEPGELLDYQVTSRLLDRLRPEADFVPCPPVSRGKEVSADAMTHRACRGHSKQRHSCCTPKMPFWSGHSASLDVSARPNPVSAAWQRQEACSDSIALLHLHNQPFSPSFDQLQTGPSIGPQTAIKRRIPLGPDRVPVASAARNLADCG